MSPVCVSSLRRQPAATPITQQRGTMRVNPSICANIRTKKDLTSLCEVENKGREQGKQSVKSLVAVRSACNGAKITMENLC